MRCSFCEGGKGHVKGCPALSDGDASMFLYGTEMGIAGKQDFNDFSFEHRTNPSFKLGFTMGSRRRSYSLLNADKEKAAWKRVFVPGSLIRSKQGPKFVAESDRGGYRYRLRYDAELDDIIISATDYGMVCFSKYPPPHDWTCLKVKSTNRRQTVVFAEPTND